MDKNATGLRPSDEAKPASLEYGRRQGEAMQSALHRMIRDIADDGAVRPADDYLVSYAVEKAEGLWVPRDGELHWQEPEAENLHLEVAVCDAADGRFLPGLEVIATLLAPDGQQVGTHRQPFLWHPWLHHYGRNWQVPGDGNYTLKVRIEPPPYARHDRINGNRFTRPVEVTFEDVAVKTGRG
ncbi:iron transporter [Falsiroseomonas sp.]|uniref:iron transporter n=1 Tax=Falsiroseomonas sp. TaxID=2870721 RepID=UPI0035695FDE